MSIPVSNKTIDFFLVVGPFPDKAPKEVTVNLGSAYLFPCPAHQLVYGVIFTWKGKKNGISFGRNERRAIGPNGDLFTYVLQEDITLIADQDGIMCTMSAANTFYSAEPLTLKIPQGKQIISLDEVIMQMFNSLGSEWFFKQYVYHRICQIAQVNLSIVLLKAL